eukprot:gb/GECH01008663.1/.p1 GENE.gb/GECH01008663.1/~~gb/GECH01008663.1/.p1  ORF type:complete len:173 (+),score=66.95 gb/GECH01008663.1/:1-519(+)
MENRFETEEKLKHRFQRVQQHLELLRREKEMKNKSSKRHLSMSSTSSLSSLKTTPSQHQHQYQHHISTRIESPLLNGSPSDRLSPDSTTQHVRNVFTNIKRKTESSHQQLLDSSSSSLMNSIPQNRRGNSSLNFDKKRKYSDTQLFENQISDHKTKKTHKNQKEKKKRRKRI